MQSCPSLSRLWLYWEKIWKVSSCYVYILKQRFNQPILHAIKFSAKKTDKTVNKAGAEYHQSIDFLIVSHRQQQRVFVAWQTHIKKTEKVTFYHKSDFTETSPHYLREQDCGERVIYVYWEQTVKIFRGSWREYSLSKRHQIQSVKVLNKMQMSITRQLQILHENMGLLFQVEWFRLYYRIENKCLFVLKAHAASVLPLPGSLFIIQYFPHF